jgi:hypothetical protein
MPLAAIDRPDRSSDTPDLLIPGLLTTRPWSMEAKTKWFNPSKSKQPNPSTRKPCSVVGLGNHTVLIARDGTQRAIDDSVAPIRGARGETVGASLVLFMTAVLDLLRRGIRLTTRCSPSRAGRSPQRKAARTASRSWRYQTRCIGVPPQYAVSYDAITRAAVYLQMSAVFSASLTCCLSSTSSHWEAQAAGARA